jgi:hypothetical protein
VNGDRVLCSPINPCSQWDNPWDKAIIFVIDGANALCLLASSGDIDPMTDWINIDVARLAQLEPGAQT